MKIERSEPQFKPVVITLETADEVKDFKQMVTYAFNQCDACSDMDRISRRYYETTKEL